MGDRIRPGNDFAPEILESRLLMSASAALVSTVHPEAAASTHLVIASSIKVSKSVMYFNQPAGSLGKSVSLTFTNTGKTALTLSTKALALSGTNAAEFVVSHSAFGLPTQLAAGKSLTLSVAFKPAAGSANTIRTASLKISGGSQSATVALRGISSIGLGGSKEPSLQRLFDLYQLPIRTGDAHPSDSTLFSPTSPLGPNDEVVAQRFQKSGTGPVTIQPLAVFAGGSPVVKFGYYPVGASSSKTQVLTVPASSAQTVNPTITGKTSFDPGAAPFGLYVTFPIFGFTNLSEDALNTAENVVANRHKMRFYQLKTSAGAVVPNAYVFTSEDIFNDKTGTYDSNDFVAIIRNVTIAP